MQAASGRVGRMARIAYNDADAAAFAATRHVPRDGRCEWRAAIARHVEPRPGTRLLDLGSGTGMWASAFADWYDIEVVAVEPSEATRVRSSHTPTLAGDAASIPLYRRVLRCRQAIANHKRKGPGPC